MIANTFFFFICIVYSGGQDCSWDFIVIDDREEFEQIHQQFKAPSDPDSNTVKAFTTNHTKEVYIHQYKIEEFIHEARHIICILEHKPPYLDICHQSVDRQIYFGR